MEISFGFNGAWSLALLLLVNVLLKEISCGNVVYREATDGNASLSRNRRQFGQLPTEINIQVTAPLFTGRLYSYGEDEGDSLLPEGLDIGKEINFLTPIAFFGETLDSFYVSSNGVIGFTAKSRKFTAEHFPLGPKLIAPLWNRNSLKKGGKVYYRQVTSGRVVDRGESEVRYQYDKSVEASFMVIVTWETMHPVADLGVGNYAPNTFQVAIINTGNGTFVNFIYKEIGWSQGAQAGFNKGDEATSFHLPDGGSDISIARLADQGNTGIPGEWMFQIDMPSIARCKPGIKGDTCDQRCSAQEWGYDCVNCCHCGEGASCSKETGECSDGRCADCWGPAPFCQTRDTSCRVEGQSCGVNAISFTDFDRCGAPLTRCQCLAGYKGDGYTCEDIDECADESTCDINAVCSNTPGRYYCACKDGYSGDGATCTRDLLYPFDGQQNLPSIPNAHVPWTLEEPITILGKEQKKIWISSNGLVLLNDIPVDPASDPEELGATGFAPYFSRMDLKRGGDIYVGESTDPDVLARANRVIGIHDPSGDFKADLVFTVTYQDVRSAKVARDAPGNTFQTVIVNGRNAQRERETYAQYLYQNLDWSQDAKAMIIGSDPANVIILPGSGSAGIKQLSQLSNVGEPGHWLFRVDQAQVQPCLDSQYSPPYCTTNGEVPQLPGAPSEPPAATDPPPAPPIDPEGDGAIPVPQFITIQPQLITPSRPTPIRVQTAPPALPTTPPTPKSTTPDDNLYLFTFPDFITIQPQLVTPAGGSRINVQPSNVPAGPRPSVVTVEAIVPGAGGDGVRKTTLLPPAFEISPPPRPTTTATVFVPQTFSPELVTPRREQPPPTTNPPQIIFANATPRIIIPELAINTPVQVAPGFNQFLTPEPPVVQITEGPKIPLDIALPEPEPTSAPEVTTYLAPETLAPTPDPEGPVLPPILIFTTPPPRTTRRPQPRTTQRPQQRTTQRPRNPFLGGGIFGGGDRTTPGVIVGGPGSKGAKPLPPDYYEEPEGVTDPNMMAIVIPTVIVGVWLLLLLIIGIVVCCRRKKNRSRLQAKYDAYAHFRAVGGAPPPIRTKEVALTSGALAPPVNRYASYEDHLDKAARISEMSQYSQNARMYGSYWNMPTNGAGGSGRPSTYGSSYYNQSFAHH